MRSLWQKGLKNSKNIDSCKNQDKCKDLRVCKSCRFKKLEHCVEYKHIFEKSKIFFVITNIENKIESKYSNLDNEISSPNTSKFFFEKENQNDKKLGLCETIGCNSSIDLCNVNKTSLENTYF